MRSHPPATPECPPWSPAMLALETELPASRTTSNTFLFLSRPLCGILLQQSGRTDTGTLRAGQDQPAGHAGGAQLPDQWASSVSCYICCCRETLCSPERDLFLTSLLLQPRACGLRRIEVLPLLMSTNPYHGGAQALAESEHFQSSFTTQRTSTHAHTHTHAGKGAGRRGPEWPGLSIRPTVQDRVSCGPQLQPPPRGVRMHRPTREREPHRSPRSPPSM